MSIIVPLVFLSALIIFHRWETQSRESVWAAVDSPARFLYASTAVRRLSLALGFCSLVLVVVGGGALGIYAAVVSTFGVSIASLDWAFRTALFGVVVGGMFLLFASSHLRPLVDKLRFFFLRHLFFPTLPSYREDRIIQQLISARAAAGEKQGSQGLGIRKDFRELSRLHGKLQKTVGRHKLSNALFHKEWEMVDGIHRSLCGQMAWPTEGSNVDLDDKVRCCLYCSYRLMIGHVFVTGFSRKQRLRQFRWFGYRVVLPEGNNWRPPAVAANS